MASAVEPVALAELSSLSEPLSPPPADCSAAAYPSSVETGRMHSDRSNVSADA